MSKFKLKTIEIEGQRSFEGHSLPLILTPSADHANTPQLMSLLLEENLTEIKEKLAIHGAILFR